MENYHHNLRGVGPFGEWVPDWKHIRKLRDFDPMREKGCTIQGDFRVCGMCLKHMQIDNPEYAKPKDRSTARRSVSLTCEAQDNSLDPAYPYCLACANRMLVKCNLERLSPDMGPMHVRELLPNKIWIDRGLRNFVRGCKPEAERTRRFYSRTAEGTTQWRRDTYMVLLLEIVEGKSTTPKELGMLTALWPLWSRTLTPLQVKGVRERMSAHRQAHYDRFGIDEPLPEILTQFPPRSIYEEVVNENQRRPPENRVPIGRAEDDGQLPGPSPARGVY